MCHTARHRLWGVQLVRKGWRRVREEGRARRDTMCRRRWTTAYAVPHGCVGVRWLRLVGERLGAKRDARRGASSHVKRGKDTHGTIRPGGFVLNPDIWNKEGQLAWLPLHLLLTGTGTVVE